MDEIMKHCVGADETENFGEALGRILQGGEVIELRGDVGAGKTTFVKGLARGLGSDDHVASPSFTLSKLYKGRLPLHHFDFYRLPDPGLIAHELQEVVGVVEEVTVIEWADSVKNVLPDDHVVIDFKSPQENERILVVTIPESLSYLKEIA